MLKILKGEHFVLVQISAITPFRVTLKMKALIAESIMPQATKRRDLRSVNANSKPITATALTLQINSLKKHVKNRKTTRPYYYAADADRQSVC